jgi:hypothetical protein
MRRTAKASRAETDRVKSSGLLDVERRHARPSAGRSLHQTLVLEASQRLPNRHAADSEFEGDIRVAQSCPREQIAVDDAAAAWEEWGSEGALHVPHTQWVIPGTWVSTGRRGSPSVFLIRPRAASSSGMRYS